MPKTLVRSPRGDVDARCAVLVGIAVTLAYCLPQPVKVKAE